MTPLSCLKMSLSSLSQHLSPATGCVSRATSALKKMAQSEKNQAIVRTGLVAATALLASAATTAHAKDIGLTKMLNGLTDSTQINDCLVGFAAGIGTHLAAYKLAGSLGVFAPTASLTVLVTEMVYVGVGGFSVGTAALTVGTIYTAWNALVSIYGNVSVHTGILNMAYAVSCLGIRQLFNEEARNNPNYTGPCGVVLGASAAIVMAALHSKDSCHKAMDSLERSHKTKVA